MSFKECWEHVNLKGLPGRIAGHSSADVPCLACYSSKEEATGMLLII
jgi:hypothetical protein